MELQSGDVVRERPVGVAEIAGLLGVQSGTVHQWRKRGIFPEPELVVSGIPAWWESSVLEWARCTGRLDSGATIASAEQSND